jgi:hypothetical protein
VSDEPSRHSRRDTLKCMAYGGAGTLFILAGGVFAPVDLAMAAEDKPRAARLGKPLFVQISDTHIGFNKDANPDVNGKPGGLGTLGTEQLAWLAADLKGRSASTPLVVFTHMPLWTTYEPWGWGTGDAGQLMDRSRRFGSVTVLNGQIHQIVQKVEGNITFHTARSTAYPQPAAGVGVGPGLLKVPADQLPKMLGITSVSVVKHPRSLALNDTTIA